MKIRVKLTELIRFRQFSGSEEECHRFRLTAYHLLTEINASDNDQVQAMMKQPCEEKISAFRLSEYTLAILRKSLVLPVLLLNSKDPILQKPDPEQMVLLDGKVARLQNLRVEYDAISWIFEPEKKMNKLCEIQALSEQTISWHEMYQYISFKHEQFGFGSWEDFTDHFYQYSLELNKKLNPKKS